MDMKVDHIEAFVAVVRRGGFTRAAARPVIELLRAGRAGG
jgi:hypothetical protein